MNGSEFVKNKDACKALGITRKTLIQWEDDGIIQVIRPRKNGARLYNIKKLKNNLLNTDIDKKQKKICYCRVSSTKQKDDLQRQIEFMQDRYPDYEIIKDIGSGINWSRSGLCKLLRLSKFGEIEEIVVAHKDRLCRFSFELLEFVFKLNGTKIVVLDNEKHNITTSSSEELAEDLLSIIHVFNCRQMGQRRYKKSSNKEQENKIISDKKTEKNTE
jgi:predicted site-specific integrase-resolvase